MIYGPARASTDARDLSNQVAHLKAAGRITIFREKMTTTDADRPQVKKLIAKLALVDLVIVTGETQRRQKLQRRPGDDYQARDISGRRLRDWRIRRALQFIREADKCDEAAISWHP